MLVLVINSGSSSLKFKLIDMPHNTLICRGLFEQIGESHGSYSFHMDLLKETHVIAIQDHVHALGLLFELLDKHLIERTSAKVGVVAHRVVHGGEFFNSVVAITPEVIKKIEECIPLAPLHNPANLLGIKGVMQHFHDLPQVAVFDTAFHQTLPPKAYTYALPEPVRAKIRRYGFHGSSHAYIAQESARILHKPLDELNIISLHLGNGASACAIRSGQSVDTSMGFTPMEGLMMGTRCGDLDPGVMIYLQESVGLSVDEIDQMLNKQSGLKGLCDESDMRLIVQRAEPGSDYARALELFVYRVKKYIGAYVAVLGRVDAIIFTGGIGENAYEVREAICENMEHLGIISDATMNAQSKAAFHRGESKIKLLCIKTDEELYIAQQAYAQLTGEIEQGKD